MTTTTLNLEQFTGTEYYYKHWLTSITVPNSKPTTTASDRTFQEIAN